MTTNTRAGRARESRILDQHFMDADRMCQARAGGGELLHLYRKAGPVGSSTDASCEEYYARSVREARQRRDGPQPGCYICGSSCAVEDCSICSGALPCGRDHRLDGGNG